VGIKVTHGGNKKMPLFSPVNPSRPFGMSKTPFNPSTGKFLPLGPAADETILVFTVQSEEDDYLVCVDSNAGIVNISKPYILQRSTFDGETVDDVSYIYSDAYTRLASEEGEDDVLQVVIPGYFEGERILAYNSQDLNAAGRTWQAYDFGTLLYEATGDEVAQQVAGHIINQDGSLYGDEAMYDTVAE